MEVESAFHKTHTFKPDIVISRPPTASLSSRAASGSSQALEYRRSSSYFPNRQYGGEQLPPAASIGTASLSVLNKVRASKKSENADSDESDDNGEVPIVFYWDYRDVDLDLGRESQQRSRQTYFDVDEDQDDAQSESTLKSKLRSAKSAKRKSAKAGSEGGGPLEPSKLSPTKVATLFREEYSRAMRFYSQRLFKRAIQSLSKALDLRPGDKYCLVARSRCYLQTGNSNEALKDADSSLKDAGVFPRGLYLKAEAFYQMGKFELALVFYHRGHHARPEMAEFRVGIQKSEEAINNIIGSGFKTQASSAKEKTNKRNKDRILLRPLAKSHVPRGSKPLVAKPQKPRLHSAISDAQASQILLGKLHNDQRFLKGLLKEEDIRPGRLKHIKSNRSQVHDLCTQGLTYLQSRAEFWRQQNPAAVNHKSRLENMGRTAGERRESYMKKLTEIYHVFMRNEFDEALVLARKLEAQVLKEPDVTFHFKPEILASAAHYIGNCLLEKHQPEQALQYFVKERTYGEECNLPGPASRSLDDMGRSFVQMMDYYSAVDVDIEGEPLTNALYKDPLTKKLGSFRRWKNKLDTTECSLIEEIWLCHEIGRCFYEVGNLSAALDYARRAFDLALKEAKSNNTVRNDDGNRWLVNCHVLLAQCYTQMDGMAEKALHHFQLAFELLVSNNDQSYLRRAVKSAITKVTERILVAKQQSLMTVYKISVAVSSLECLASTKHGEVFVMLTGTDDSYTGMLSMGKFRRTEIRGGFEFSIEAAHRRVSDFQHGEVYIEGCKPSFVVDGLTVVDLKSARQWMFATDQGSWANLRGDITKRVWRMKPQ